MPLVTTTGPPTMSKDDILVHEHSPNREEIQRIGEQIIDNMIRQFADTTHVDSPSTPKTECQARITSSCQTDEYPGTPYAITKQLPPLFSSKLCFPSPRIKYLTRSLPNLDTVQWVHTTEVERIRDEAEGALAEHYNTQVKQFYLDNKERVSTGEIETSRPQVVRDRSVDMNTNDVAYQKRIIVTKEGRETDLIHPEGVSEATGTKIAMNVPIQSWVGPESHHRRR